MVSKPVMLMVVKYPAYNGNGINTIKLSHVNLFIKFTFNLRVNSYNYQSFIICDAVQTGIMKLVLTKSNTPESTH